MSISHSGPHVLVAVTPAGPGVGPLGVDVERDRAVDVAAIAPVVLSSGERARLAQLPPCEHSRALLRAWTRKEALLKADGVGLVRTPSSVEVDLVRAASAPGPGVLQVGHGAGPAWRLYDVVVAAGLVVAVATSGPARIAVHSPVLLQETG